MLMTKNSVHQEVIPEQAVLTLRRLGDNLRVARQRRHEPLRAWAQRMQVSVPTLMRMERGDPSVGMGVYATAIWLVGGLETLAHVGSPEYDHVAMVLDTHRARQRGAKS